MTTQIHQSSSQEPNGQRKKMTIVGVAVSLLIAGAVIAGVLGSRKANSKIARPDPKSAIKPLEYDVVGALFNGNQMVVPDHNVSIQQQLQPLMDSTLADDGMVAPNNQKKDGHFFSNGISSLATKNASAKAVVPIGAIATNSWKAAGGANSVVCYPKNGTEIVEMTGAASPCTVIVLRRQGERQAYQIGQTLNISTPKIIVGNPLNNPMINCTNRIQRLFDVFPGGRLDIRFVNLVRGFGTRLGERGELRLTVASHVLVRLGGSFTATGCLFRERPNTARTFMEEVRQQIQDPTSRNRNIGQLILVVGGNLHLVGCRFFRNRPYGTGIFNNMTIGRDVLVIAGNFVSWAPITYGSNLFASNLWISGNNVAVLGGTAVLIGGVMLSATGVQLQIGFGCQTFVAAGVLITIGWQYTSTNLGVARVNGGQFSAGAGIHIMIGFLQGRAWGVGAVFGPGQTYVCATGIYHKIGCAFASFAIATIFCGCGGSMWTGTGEVVYVGVGRSSISVAASTYGLGSNHAHGAGGHHLIYFEQGSANVARWQAGIGSDYWLGAGWSTNINNTRYSYAFVNAFTGAGNQVMVGRGGAIFIRCYSYSRRWANWQVGPFTYTVGGTGTRRARGNNILITKHGEVEYVYNRTSKTVKKTFTPSFRKTPHPTRSPASVPWDKKDDLYPGLAKAKSSGRRKEQGRDLLDTKYFKDIDDSVGGFLPDHGESKLVMLQNTMMQAKGKPPKAEQFASKELKRRWGGFPKILADGLVDMPEALEVTPGKVSTDDASCFLCNIGPGATQDHVGGPGACEVNDQCQGDDSVELYATAQASTALDLAMPGMRTLQPNANENGDVILPDTTLLWHEMVVHCKSTDPSIDDASITKNCLTPAYIKAVIIAYMGEEFSKTSSVAVSSAGMPSVTSSITDGDEVFAQAMGPATSDSHSTCQGWSKYNIYVTSNDEETGAILTQMWEDIIEDPTPLSDDLVTNYVASASDSSSSHIQPCSVTFTQKTITKFPALERMPAYQPSDTLGSFGPDIVVSSDTSIVPVSKLVVGQEYKMFVQNFPENSQVDISLINKKTKAFEGGQLVAVIDSFEDDGTTQITWTVREDMLVDGEEKYYLRAVAKNFPALFANSLPFKITMA